MFGKVRGWLLARRTLKTLSAIDARLAEQNRYLRRLADHFAPEPAPLDERVIASQTGVDHLNPVEMAVVLDYVDRTQRDTGRPPTDEEILRYLADEATVDLQARMEGR